MAKEHSRAEVVDIAICSHIYILVNNKYRVLYKETSGFIWT